MEKTLADNDLALEPSGQKATEMRSMIGKFIAQIDELRKEIRHDQEAIERSSTRTDAILAEIHEILGSFRAA